MSSEARTAEDSLHRLLAGTRVAFFVEDETTFIFSAVHRTIEALRDRGAEVVGIGVVPSRLGPHRGIQIPLWYLRRFGVGATALLATYKALEWVRRHVLRGVGKLPFSWQALATQGRLRLDHFSNPNSEAARRFLTETECDLLFILVPYVLSRDVLRIPTLGTINKHAALLPGCRGLMPYIWSVLEGRELGVTFHQVVEEIDAGPVLTQQRLGRPPTDVSMLAFYQWVFRLFPEMACQAAEALVSRKPVMAPEDPGSYYSLPTREDCTRFRRAGGKVGRFADFWRS